MLTQEKLKETLYYNPKTGIFTWLKKPNRKIVLGSIAGCKRSDGRIVIDINKQTYYAHHLVFLYVYGEIPKEIDHINHDPSDNSLENIRTVSHAENMRNRKIPKNNRSKYIGVYWNKERSKWQVQISIGCKNTYIGRFDKKIDAILARDEANKKYGYHYNHGVL